MKRIPIRARDGSIRAHVLVDDEDFERFGGHRWSLQSAGYAYRWEREGARRRCVLLHRAIMGLEHGDEREVDHRDRDGLNCRRENLRVVTHGQNAQNVPARGRSRFRGVGWDKGRGRWQSYAAVGGRRRWLGRFLSEVDAALAAEAARREAMPFALPDPELVAMGLA